MNSIEMIYRISRYYIISERTMDLFFKSTKQMIANSKHYILDSKSNKNPWTREPRKFIQQLEFYSPLHEAYQDKYHANGQKLYKISNGKQYAFHKYQIFGKFNLFCLSVITVIDFFSAVDKFSSLSKCRLERTEPMVKQFYIIMKEFCSKGQDLQNYHQSNFDGDSNN